MRDIKAVLMNQDLPISEDIEAAFHEHWQVNPDPDSRSIRADAGL